MPEWRGEESEGGRGEERQGRERKVGRTRGRVGDDSGGWRAREGEEGGDQEDRHGCESG